MASSTVDVRDLCERFSRIADAAVKLGSEVSELVNVERIEHRDDANRVVPAISSVDYVALRDDARRLIRGLDPLNDLQLALVGSIQRAAKRGALESPFPGVAVSSELQVSNPEGRRLVNCWNNTFGDVEKPELDMANARADVDKMDISELGELPLTGTADGEGEDAASDPRNPGDSSAGPDPDGNPGAIRREEIIEQLREEKTRQIHAERVEEEQRRRTEQRERNNERLKAARDRHVLSGAACKVLVDAVRRLKKNAPVSREDVIDEVIRWAERLREEYEYKSRAGGVEPDPLWEVVSVDDVREYVNKRVGELNRIAVPTGREAARQSRYLRIGKPDENGMVAITGRLTPEVGALLIKTLGPLARRGENWEGSSEDGGVGRGSGEAVRESQLRSTECADDSRDGAEDFEGTGEQERTDELDGSEGQKGTGELDGSEGLGASEEFGETAERYGAGEHEGTGELDGSEGLGASEEFGGTAERHGAGEHEGTGELDGSEQRESRSDGNSATGVKATFGKPRAGARDERDLGQRQADALAKIIDVANGVFRNGGQRPPDSPRSMIMIATDSEELKTLNAAAGLVAAGAQQFAGLFEETQRQLNRAAAWAERNGGKCGKGMRGRDPVTLIKGAVDRVMDGSLAGDAAFNEIARELWQLLQAIYAGGRYLDPVTGLPTEAPPGGGNAVHSLYSRTSTPVGVNPPGTTHVGEQAVIHNAVVSRSQNLAEAQLPGSAETTEPGSDMQLAEYDQALWPDLLTGEGFKALQTALTLIMTKTLENDTGIPLTLGEITRLGISNEYYVCEIDPWTGRAKSLVSKNRSGGPLFRAIKALEEGVCVMPGGTMAAALCELHHVVAWAKNQVTELDNLVLVSASRHRANDDSRSKRRKGHFAFDEITKLPGWKHSKAEERSEQVSVNYSTSAMAAPGRRIRAKRIYRRDCERRDEVA